jgi:hypothetical protein
MNGVKRLAQIGEEIEENLPSLGAWQRRGLAVLVFGLMALGHAQLSKIAEGVPEEGSYNTLRQRVKGWVSNRELPWVKVGYEWVRWVWRQYGGQRAVLLVDETKLGDRFGVMLVSLAYDGRAIPLWWRCSKAKDAPAYPQQGQVLLIYGLLAHVLSALPERARPLVQMDRGLAHSSALLRALASLRVDYWVRVKATARFTSRSGCSQLLKHWVTPGPATPLRGRLFDRDPACTGPICLIWELGQSEAWCLFTPIRRGIGR